MSIKFNTVKNVSRVAVVAVACAICASMLFGQGLAQFYEAMQRAALFCACGCAMTFLLFLGFPRLRRADLVEIMILAGCLAMIAKYAITHRVEAFSLAGWSAGALTVACASHIERVRSMMRRRPGDDFSMAYEDDRRAARKPGLLSPQATSDKMAREAVH